MGKQTRRRRLEEHDRRPGDHQDVEDEPGGRRALVGLREQRPAVQEHLLAEHDHQDRCGETAALCERELGVAIVRPWARGVGRPRAGAGRTA